MAEILCVDDVEDNLALLEVVLEDAGHEVRLATSGPAALASVRERAPDVVLLDVQMPGMDGLQVLRRLRADHAITDLPVVMVTALGDVEHIVGALSLGANDYVVKPLKVELVRARVSTQLDIVRLTRERRELSLLRDEIVSMASHDLKSPLTAVGGFAQLLLGAAREGAMLTEDHVRMLESIERSATTMGRIVRDFLDFQALEAGGLTLRTEAVDLAEVAGRIVARHAGVAERKGVRLRLATPPPGPRIEADPEAIARVIDNYVSNAIKFATDDTFVTVCATQTDAHARLEVADTGPGISEPDMARAFQKYQRLSNRPTGGEKSSGLGLYICRRLIEAHGGRVGVGATPGGGATFWAVLPASVRG